MIILNINKNMKKDFKKIKQLYLFKLDHFMKLINYNKEDHNYKYYKMY